MVFKASYEEASPHIDASLYMELWILQAERDKTKHMAFRACDRSPVFVKHDISNAKACTLRTRLEEVDGGCGGRETPFDTFPRVGLEGTGAQNRVDLREFVFRGNIPGFRATEEKPTAKTGSFFTSVTLFLFDEFPVLLVKLGS